MTVLVAYATSRGSTQGIAERIVDRLRVDGIAAEAKPVTEALDVGQYDAVVFGSAVHGGKWLPEAVGFATEHADALARRLVWLFSVSTVGDQESMYPPRAAKKLAAMRKETNEIAALREALRAREHRNFAGAVAPADWPATGRAVFRLMGGGYGDHRNWEAIEAWAHSIGAEVSAVYSRTG